MTGTEGESQMCPGFLGAAPALRAHPPPTPLACTLTYLSSVGNQMLFIYFFFSLSHMDSKATGAQANDASQSWIGQGSRAGFELANLSLKTKAWVEYAHASSYTVYNQEYVKAVCVYMTRSLCFPLSLSPSPLPWLQPLPCLSSSTLYFPEDKIINISE